MGRINYVTVAQNLFCSAVHMWNLSCQRSDSLLASPCLWHLIVHTDTDPHPQTHKGFGVRRPRVTPFPSCTMTAKGQTGNCGAGRQKVNPRDTQTRLATGVHLFYVLLFSMGLHPSHDSYYSDVPGLYFPFLSKE